MASQTQNRMPRSTWKAMFTWNNGELYPLDSWGLSRVRLIDLDLRHHPLKLECHEAPGSNDYEHSMIQRIFH